MVIIMGRFPVTIQRSLSFTDELYLTHLFSLSTSNNLTLLSPSLTDIVDDLRYVSHKSVVQRAVAVLPGVPGQVPLQLGQEGVH